MLLHPVKGILLLPVVQKIQELQGVTSSISWPSRIYVPK